MIDQLERKKPKRRWLFGTLTLATTAVASIAVFSTDLLSVNDNIRRLLGWSSPEVKVQKASMVFVMRKNQTFDAYALVDFVTEIKRMADWEELLCFGLTIDGRSEYHYVARDDFLLLGVGSQTKRAVFRSYNQKNIPDHVSFRLMCQRVSKDNIDPSQGNLNIISPWVPVDVRVDYDAPALK